MGITVKNNKPVTKNMTIKGDDGVGIKTITSGTPVVTEEKTTTPITVTLTDETTQNFNVEAQNGSGGDNALTKPTTAPSATQIVAVDNTNTQTMLNIGDGLTVENGSLTANGGTGGKKYLHKLFIYLNTNSTERQLFCSFEFVNEKSTPYQNFNEFITDNFNKSTFELPIHPAPFIPDSNYLIERCGYVKSTNPGYACTAYKMNINNNSILLTEDTNFSITSEFTSGDSVIELK